VGIHCIEADGPVDPGFVREFAESTLAQRVPLEFMETMVQENLKVPARVWKATFEDSWRTILSAYSTESLPLL